MITLDEFLKKYLGQTKGYPDDNSFKGECLSIVKLYIKEVFGINPPPSGTNSAYGYWSNFPNPLGTKFEKVLNTDELIPEAGWIVIWKPWTSNIYGHIGIVAEGCTTGTLKNYAQNWTSKVFQLESNRYTNVVGFLRPIKSSNDDMTLTDEQKRILEFIADKTEGDVREAFGALADLKRLETKLKDLETSIEKLQDQNQKQDLQIKNLTSKLEGEIKNGQEWQSELKSANGKISRLEKQLETKDQEVIEAREVSNKYQRLYKEALSNSVAKLNSWELFKLLVQKLSWKK